MTEVRRKYRVTHIHYIESTQRVLLCLDQLEKLRGVAAPIVAPTGTEEEIFAGRMIQATLKAMEGVVPAELRTEYPEKLLKIEITLEDYEKIGRPGILDEVILTLEAAKETT